MSNKRRRPLLPGSAHLGAVSNHDPVRIVYNANEHCNGVGETGVQQCTAPPCTVSIRYNPGGKVLRDGVNMRTARQQGEALDAKLCFDVLWSTPARSRHDNTLCAGISIVTPLRLSGSSGGGG